MVNINVMKLDRELRAAGIPIDGCSSDGRIDFQPTATDAQKTQAAAILANHDPSEPTVPSLEDQVAALRQEMINMKLGL